MMWGVSACVGFKSPSPCTVTSRVGELSWRFLHLAPSAPVAKLPGLCVTLKKIWSRGNTCSLNSFLQMHTIMVWAQFSCVVWRWGCLQFVYVVVFAEVWCDAFVGKERIRPSLLMKKLSVRWSGSWNLGDVWNEWLSAMIVICMIRRRKMCRVCFSIFFSSKFWCLYNILNDDLLLRELYLFHLL